MAKKKPGPKPKPSTSLHVMLPTALRLALDKATAQTRRKLSAEVVVAIEKHVAELGFWPPK